MFKKLRKKAFYRWLGIATDSTDLEFEKEFLAEMWESEGFQSYISFRNISILKELGTGLDWNQYNHWLGRRKELLFLASEAKKQFEVRELNNKLNK
jgi:hypothetical protein